jgi:NAD(P)-dependent dehydrogenase (short-subunit alcohol dehydrogenase family)
MKLLKLRATGGIGLEIVRQAIDAGHQVTALVARPSGSKNSLAASSFRSSPERSTNSSKRKELRCVDQPAARLASQRVHRDNSKSRSAHKIIRLTIYRR